VPQKICLWLLLIALPALAQTPEALLSGLSAEDQRWVNLTCPRTLPPSLWNRCITREANALTGGMPDLSALQPEQRDWIDRSCPYTLGPRLTISCRTRELSALSREGPDLSKLSSEHRAWVLRSCPSTLGPRLTLSCLERQVNALAGGVPDLSMLSQEHRSWILRSCPNSLGPQLAISCLNRERNALVNKHDSVSTRTPSRAPPQSSNLVQSYAVDGAHNEELFVINGQTFKAQTNCSNLSQGDTVTFTEGDPSGRCQSAVLLNVRTQERCAVWCM
jgi:hypothetical protein